MRYLARWGATFRMSPDYHRANDNLLLCVNHLDRSKHQQRLRYLDLKKVNPEFKQDFQSEFATKLNWYVGLWVKGSLRKL